MANTGGSVDGRTLEYTPTWVVAVVCFIIVVISFAVERALSFVGQVLAWRRRKAFLEALQKIKEELMMLRFISLLLTVFQTRIENICISQQLASKWHPCKNINSSSTTVSITHFLTTSFPRRGRRLLAETSTDYCGQKGKVPFLSLTALHHLHIFIFVLAVFHVIVCVLIFVCSEAKIRHWRRWEDTIRKDERFNDPTESLNTKLTRLQNHALSLDKLGKYSARRSWLVCLGIFSPLSFCYSGITVLMYMHKPFPSLNYCKTKNISRQAPRDFIDMA